MSTCKFLKGSAISRGAQVFENFESIFWDVGWCLVDRLHIGLAIRKVSAETNWWNPCFREKRGNHDFERFGGTFGVKFGVSSALRAMSRMNSNCASDS